MGRRKNSGEGASSRVSNGDAVVDANSAVDGQIQGKRKGKHDKPKPWDTDDIDHWKLDAFDPKWNDGGMLEVSSFATLFPQYREQYLQDAWPEVTRALKEHGIACELNLVEGSMTVTTTIKTRDPFIIVKARDLLKLLSRSVPVSQALKILDDDVQCDIIKIGSLIRNKDRFVKRRQRLLGPNGATAKAIEMLTGCYMMVQGNTVAAMGSFKGLKVIRRIIEDCIKNIHPIYHIKELMIKRELAKDPELANENWERFLPKFKKRNVKTRKTKEKKKKHYTPFPPPQQLSKVDLQLESGEYFLSEEAKAAKKKDGRREKQAEKVAENKRKREASFVPPKETRERPVASEKSQGHGASSAGSTSDFFAMTESLKKKAKVASETTAVAERRGIDDYLATPSIQSRKSNASRKGKT